MASCANCGHRLAKSSRYCPQCGQAVAEGGTKVLELPPDETGQVPVEYTRAERHYYGVTPVGFAVALAAAAVVAGIVLFATGHWPLGLILLGVAVLLLLVSVETRAFRDRAGVAADSVATRGRATTRLLGLRRELRKLAVLRGRLLFELGDAVYRGDERATEAARQRLAELDEAWRQRESEMQTVMAQAQDRLHRRRLEVQPTEMVELPEEPAAPWEQDPVGPAVIPEPYPPPDEGNPPEPAVIPEPGPMAPEREGD
jgi:membrane protein implicated in regulation of membrane protease activity